MDALLMASRREVIADRDRVFTARPTRISVYEPSRSPITDESYPSYPLIDRAAAADAGELEW